jgi:hypothetical protein
VAQRCLLRRPEAAAHRLDVRQDQQHLGADLATQDRGHAVLVDHRVNALQPELWIGVDRRAATTARDHNVPGGHEMADHRSLDDPDRHGAWRQSPPAATLGLLFPDAHAACLEPGHLRAVERMADGLRRRPQVRVVGVAQRLGDDGDDAALDPSAGQCVLQ